MSDMEITIRLPEELVARLQRVGVRLDDPTKDIVAYYDDQARKREAMSRLNQAALELQSLPPELKPTPEEIEAEIRAYWAEKAASDKTG